MAPLFTIAVTTYNRKEMLKECLASISQQNFSNYEVIIGNNYTEEALTRDALGISDPRVSIINHQRDLGQLGNMNFLLIQAKGRYFTWLCDDDLLTPQCLDSINIALKKFSFPKCVFCLYNDGSEYIPEPTLEVNDRSQLLSGAAFLRQYLSRKLKLIGCYGGFETSYLKEIGGVQNLGNGFAPYADQLLAIKAGVLDEVAYVDVPLFFFRTHDQSISYTSPDLTAYTSAQQDLLGICEEVFMTNNLSNDYDRNMYHLLVWFSGDIYEVSRRNDSLIPNGVFNHLRVLERYARRTGWLYFKFLILNIWFSAVYIFNWIFPKRGQNEASDP